MNRSLGENTSKVTRSNTRKCVSFSKDTRFNTKIINSNSESNNNLSNSYNNISHLGKGSDDTATVEGEIEDFQYLIGKYHRDNEDYQRYVTDKIYIDKSSGNIVGERVLILKDGRRHRSADPYPIHVRDLAEMTRQYEEESSPHVQKALIVNLLEITKNEDELLETLPNISANTNNSICMQSQIIESDDLSSEQFSKILMSRLREDELVNYCLEAKIGIAGILTPSTRRQAMSTPQRELWLEAERKEIESINKKKILEPAQWPNGK